MPFRSIQLVSSQEKNEPLLCGLKQRSSFCKGFTLVEVLVSLVVLTVAVLGSIVAFNLIISSVRGTELRAGQSRRIDRDIARILSLSERYGACTNPAGVIDDPCPDPLGSEATESFFYFPKASTILGVAPENDPVIIFESNCASGDIVDNFIQAVNDPDVTPAPGGDVVRSSAVRVGTGNNHLVRIQWLSAAGRPLRELEIAPVISSWCP